MVLKTIFLGLLFYLVLANWKLKRSLSIERALQSFLQKARRKEFFHRIELLIKSSAVDKYLPFFNLYIFLGLTILLFVGTGIYAFSLTGGWFLALAFGTLAGIIPFVCLELLRVINIRRVRNNYHGFLCSLIGFFSLSGDVVGSYDSAADYTGEPLKSFVKDAVYKYNRSNTGFELCLDELAERANEREFVKLLKFTKLYLAYGGDYFTVLNKLNYQSHRLENARLTLYSSAYIGIIAIAVMILIDFAAIFSLFTRDPNTARILGTTLAGNGFMLLNLGAVVFSIYIAFRLFRGDV